MHVDGMTNLELFMATSWSGEQHAQLLLVRGDDDHDEHADCEREREREQLGQPALASREGLAPVDSVPNFSVVCWKLAPADPLGLRLQLPEEIEMRGDQPSALLRVRSWSSASRDARRCLAIVSSNHLQDPVATFGSWGFKVSQPSDLQRSALGLGHASGGSRQPDLDRLVRRRRRENGLGRVEVDAVHAIGVRVDLLREERRGLAAGAGKAHVVEINLVVGAPGREQQCFSGHRRRSRSRVPMSICIGKVFAVSVGQLPRPRPRRQVELVLVPVAAEEGALDGPVFVLMARHQERELHRVLRAAADQLGASVVHAEDIVVAVGSKEAPVFIAAAAVVCWWRRVYVRDRVVS